MAAESRSPFGYAGFMFPLARTLPCNNAHASVSSHICQEKQNQGYVTGSGTQATFRTTEKKPKIKKTFIHLYELSRVVKFRETESRMVAATGWG